MAWDVRVVHGGLTGVGAGGTEVASSVGDTAKMLGSLWREVTTPSLY